jgi:transcriptional regulator with XRE-family HTH domain
MLKSMTIDVCVKVGRRIQILRSQRGMSQIALAQLSDINRPNLSRIENGHAEPCLRTLHKIAKSLGINLSALFKGID